MVVPRFSPHEVGAGFFDRDHLIAWLGNFTGAQLAWIAAPHAPGSAALRSLSELKIFVEPELETLADVVADTAPIWRYDVRTGALSMRGELSGR